MKNLTAAIIVLACTLLLACEQKSKSSAPAESSTDTSKTDTKTNQQETPSEAEAKTDVGAVEGADEGTSTSNRGDSTNPSPKDLLTNNAALTEIIAALPQSMQSTAAERGYWKGDAFSTEFESGAPAVRVVYKSSESKTLDSSQPSGFGKIEDDQKATLIVVHTEDKTNQLFEHLANEMARRGFSEEKLRTIGGSSENEKITMWRLEAGAVYLARTPELVLYAVEQDSGKAGSASFGAQQIIVFREVWSSR